MRTNTRDRLGFSGFIQCHKDGTSEVKHVLEHECDILVQCRVCGINFHDIMSFVSHKRTQCKTSVKSELDAKTSEFIGKLQNELKKQKDGLLEVSAFCRQGKSNIETILAERHEAAASGMFGLPLKEPPLTNIRNGVQGLVEKSDEPERVVVVMPQDYSSSYGEMRLRKRRGGDKFVELDQISFTKLKNLPDDVMPLVGTNGYSCLSVHCKDFRPFEEFDILMYHLSVTHQEEGSCATPKCYLCFRQFTSFARLKNHMQAVHEDVRSRHSELRSRQRTKKRVVADRSSLSPTGFTDSTAQVVDAKVYEPDCEKDTDSPVPPKVRTPRKPTPKKAKKVASPSKRALESLDEQISVIVANAVSRSQMENAEVDDVDSHLNIKRPQSPRKKRARSQEAIATDSVSTPHSGSPDGSETSSDNKPVSLIAGRSPRQRVLTSRLHKDFVVPKKFRAATESTLLFSDDHVKVTSKAKRKNNTRVTQSNLAKSNAAERAQSNPLDAATEVKVEPESSNPTTPVAPPDPSPSAILATVFSSKRKTRQVEFGRNDPFLGKPRSEGSSANTSPLKTIFPSALIGETKEAETLNSPRKMRPGEAEGVPPVSNETRGEAASRRKQNFADLDKKEGASSEVKVIQVGQTPRRPDDLLSLPVMLTQGQRKMFFAPLKPLFSEKDLKAGKDGLHQCAECGQTCRNLPEGQKHMIGHVRSIRLRCSLCDAGAFFCADIRKHLMYRYCEFLHLAPKEMVQPGSPCMTPQMADKLIRIADTMNPGRAVYTSGKLMELVQIITNECPTPYFPDPKIEQRILGSQRPAVKLVSPRKLPILNRASAPRPSLGDQPAAPTTSASSSLVHLAPVPIASNSFSLRHAVREVPQTERRKAPSPLSMPVTIRIDNINQNFTKSDEVRASCHPQKGDPQQRQLPSQLSIDPAVQQRLWLVKGRECRMNPTTYLVYCMYPTSTQKAHWTFPSVEAVNALRREASETYRNKLRPGLADPDEESLLLGWEDELKLCRIVSETGVRFGDEFQPRMWPAVRWTAFAYFKRFFLRHSAMEYSPKNIMMASYFLATKVDEFNISIHDFVANLRSGTPQSNAEMVLHWEPIIMFKLNYELTVHCPFRPFEGHLMEMKTHGMLGFDLENIRDHSDAFFKNCLLGDVMLIYPPTHVALAALQYGLNKMGKMKDIFREHVHRLCQVDTWNPSVENSMLADKLMLEVEEIIRLVEEQARPIPAEERQVLQKERIPTFMRIQNETDERLKTVQPKSDSLDSDDD